MQAHLKLRLSVWSYNGAVRGWDPVVEPWDVLANMDTNLKGKGGGWVGGGTVGVGGGTAHTCWEALVVPTTLQSPSY